MKERKAENACNGVKHCLKNSRAARGKGRGKKERWRGGWREWREEEWRVWGGRGIHTLIMSANCFIEAQNSAENELMSASFFSFRELP